MEAKPHGFIESFNFFVPGVPQPKGSWFVSRQGKLYRRKSQSDWEKTMQTQARAVLTQGVVSHLELFVGPVEVKLRFVLPRPKTVDRTLPSVRPDLDKLERAVLDSLTGVVLVDDGQVVKLSSTKEYVSTNGAVTFGPLPCREPGVFIEVRVVER